MRRRVLDWRSRILDPAEALVTVDPERVEHHPLVASRALLSGNVRPLPSPLGTRASSGALGSGTLDTLMSVAEALFSSDAGAPPAERITWLRSELSDFMGRGTFTGRALFTIAAFAISLFAPLRVGRLPPFRRMPLGKRVHALQVFEASRLSPLLIAVRAILCLLYYEHPDAVVALGFDATGPEAGKLYEPRVTP